METSVQKLDTGRPFGRQRVSRIAVRGGVCLWTIVAAVPRALAQAPGAAGARSTDLQPPLVMTQTGTVEQPAPVAPSEAEAAGADQVGSPLALTQLDEGSPSPGRLESGGTFSLRFAEPMPITELLLFLVRDTPYSIVPDPDVSGQFIGELKDVTLLQALDLVLRPLDLDYAVHDGSIRVFTRRLETRLYAVDHVTTRRSSRRVLSGLGAADGDIAASSGGSEDGAMRLVGVDEADVYGELAVGVRTLLSERGRFNLDRKAALLQVTDFPDRLNRVTAYLDAVAARVNRQVVIDAAVVEIELGPGYGDGLDWEALRATIADSSSLGSGRSGLVVGLPAGDPEALLAALASQGRINVLAKPRVVTTNNEPAVMQVGTQDVFFVTTAEVERNGRVRRSVAVPQRITEGLTLSVTPQIGQDGIIGMSIAPRVIGRTGETTSPDGDVVPVMTVRETDTVVRVYDGETVVVAGLMRDDQSTVREKVPVLGHIPLLGRAFRRNRTVETKTDLIILLTPRIVTPGRVSAALRRH